MSDRSFFFIALAAGGFVCLGGFTTMYGCVPPFDPIAFMEVRGNILDADTGLRLTDAEIRGRSLTNGVETAESDLLFLGTLNNPVLPEDGAFELLFIALYRIRIPRPDQVEVFVVREECEHRYSIDVNEDTVVDLDLFDDVLELKNPIVVPLCEP